MSAFLQVRCLLLQKAIDDVKSLIDLTVNDSPKTHWRQTRNCCAQRRI